MTAEPDVATSVVLATDETLERDDQAEAAEDPSATVIVMDGDRSRKLFATLAKGAIAAGVGFLRSQLGERFTVHAARPKPKLPVVDGNKLGYAEAAQLLGIPIGTLRSMVCRHQIPHIRLSPRIVIFDAQALRAWLLDRAVPVGNDNDVNS